MKKIILDIVKEKGQKGISSKKLHKKLKESDENYDDNDINKIIDKLISKNKLVNADGFLKIQSGGHLLSVGDPVEVNEEEIESVEPLSKKRKQPPTVDDNEATDSVTNKSKVANASNTNKSNDKSKLKDMYPELWRTGEQLWRDNGFNQEYLLQNPDNITRIFCGNLNKNITEEQLRGCIENITYIKWITDRETQQFYGIHYYKIYILCNMLMHIIHICINI